MAAAARRDPQLRLRGYASKLDPNKPRIDQWLAKALAVDASRIHQDLVRDFGFDGSYQTVRRYVERADRLPSLAATAIASRLPPGHQAQVAPSHMPETASLT